MLYFEREIREQPESLTRFLDRQADNVARIAAAVRRHDVAHIVITARGTSDNAATYGRYVLESRYGKVVSLAAPSLFTLYRQPPRLHQALAIGISQSGQGTDVVEVIAEARRQGALTLAITNYADSPLAAAAQEMITLEAGEERAVAATKTYTAQLLALALLTAYLTDSKEDLEALQKVPEAINRALGLDRIIREGVERYRYMQTCIVLSRGYNYATAFEVALKLKETCYLAAQPYSTADFRHGPMAMVSEGFPAMIIGPFGAVFEDVLACARELRERRAELVALSDQPELLELARLPLAMPPDIPEWLSPIIYVVPGQLFALYLALTRGYDPDQPRGLTKVTLTR